MGKFNGTRRAVDGVGFGREALLLGVDDVAEAATVGCCTSGAMANICGDTVDKGVSGGSADTLGCDANISTAVTGVDSIDG